ncbi:MAG: DUF2461 domain-containing protein [Acutalibacter sp.]|nr:DUF2461 domain-containing protein [Acutalibacter sp.]
MEQTLSDRSIDFLWELSLHNERPWFLEHKEEFERVLHRPFKALAAETARLMQARWPQKAFTTHVSRIYRDARRLYGRGPYQDNLWFSLQKGDAHASGPMLWFEINQEGTSHGVGFWDRTAQQALAFRKKLDKDPARFQRLVEALPDFSRGRIWGEEYKRPKGDLGPVLNPWYNRKQASWGYENYFGQALFDSGLSALLAESFSSLMPLYDFFREAYEEAVQEAYHP